MSDHLQTSKLRTWIGLCISRLYSNPYYVCNMHRSSDSCPALWFRSSKTARKFKSFWSDVFLNQEGPLSGVWRLKKKFGGGGPPGGCFFVQQCDHFKSGWNRLSCLWGWKKPLGVLLYKISFRRYWARKLKIPENRGTLTTPCRFICELAISF